MKMGLPSLAIRRPITVLMVVITLLGLGGIAWSRIPLAFLPKMDFPFIICWIPYPGATPEQVENEVAIPAEGEFRTITQLKRISTTSDNEGCFIRMSFDFAADMDLASAEVRDRMERLKLRLPDGVDRLYLHRWSSDSFPIVFFSISSDRNYEDLSNIARTIMKPRLTRIDGVADVQVHGKPEPEVLVEFDQSVLRARGLGLYDLVTNLQTSSLSISVGELNEADATYYVRLQGEYERPQDIADLVVGPHGLRLKDVAKVGYSSRELEGDYSFNGKNALVVSVQKESEANTVEVCRKVIAELQNVLDDPTFEGVEEFVIFDQSEIITSALGALLDAGKYGGLLALLVLFLFLRRIRPTLLVALAIPTSVVAGFVFMFFTGMTLNLVTMISLIVALGMLVDNSIVVIENIYRYNQLGYGPVESARRGASEVGTAITAATLTTLVVFVPILYLESGSMATYFKEFGLPITVALLASLLVALTVIPLAACHMPELGKEKPKRIRRRIRTTSRRALGRKWHHRVAVVTRIHPLNGLINVYIRCLKWTLRWRLAAVILIFILLGATALPGRALSRKGMPEPDQRQVMIQLSFEQNFNLDMSREYIDSLLASIDERRSELGIENVFANFGPRWGEVLVFLKQKEDLPPGEELPYKTEQVRDILWQSLPQRLPGMELELGIGRSGEAERGIGIAMRGDDSRILNEYAEDLKQLLIHNVPELTEVTTDEDRAEEEIRLQVDESLAAEAGVSPMMIARTVDFALRGARMPYLKHGGREVPVWAQFREEDRKTRGNLDNVTVVTQEGDLVPLTRFVDFAKGTSPHSIRRENGKNVSTVVARTDADGFNKVLKRVKAVVANFNLPRGYSISFGENVQEFERDMANFITAMLLTIVLIYVVMAALFESYLLPLSILWTLPLAFVGVVWFMYLTDSAMDTVALIGMVLMTGIVVNNGIVIVDHINQLRGKGIDRFEAIVQGGRDRFRPVMMTALTTILGCVPLALGGAFGSEVTFESLGRALIGGLTSGTILTLIVVPLIYTLIDDLRDWLAAFFADIARLRQPAANSAN